MHTGQRVEGDAFDVTETRRDYGVRAADAQQSERVGCGAPINFVVALSWIGY